jgi:HMG (high mobility group) box
MTEDYRSMDKDKTLAAKRPTKKKPKDKPKRPLSAYNFFFKEEREKILKVVLAEDPSTVDNDPNSEDYLDDDQLRRLRKEGGKVSFEEMGKLIGQRWKNIDPDRLTRFSELASEDTERYKKEMQTYNGRQEAKMRSEALKPPPTFSSRQDMSKAPDPRSQSGYPGMEPMPGMNSAFANTGMAPPGYPNPYGGMEYGGYGMGMGAMYGPYGGYPGMGGVPMGGGGHESMSQMGGRMGDPMAGQYGAGAPPGMYGMMGGGGYQGGMMGYGGGPPQGPPGDYGPPQPGMDPQGPPPGMYGGYGPPGGWGQQ